MIKKFDSGHKMKSIETKLVELYGDSQTELELKQRRYKCLIEKYSEIFSSNDELFYISTPGRTELAGNHTDHNNGKVIAASVNLDSIAAFTKKNSRVLLKSDIYESIFDVDIKYLERIEDETETTNALIRGIAKGFVERGYKIGGFKGVLSSDVVQGSGLSSSASIEILIASIFNFLYNNNEIPPIEIAKIAQFAENEYFGKPCGLMDQIACAAGGIVAIDFKDNSNPIIKKLDPNFNDFGYKLLVLNTGGTHHNLTEDYSAIPREMKEVAAFFDKSDCSDLEMNLLLDNWTELRKGLSDRALLRTMHFISENKRVSLQVNALDNKDIERFLDLVKKSGDSSFKYLQNIYSINNVHQQPLSLALAVTNEYIAEIGRGACRVHGGGFAGTIQVFLPEQNVHEYELKISNLFGSKSLKQLRIRNCGPIIFPIPK